MNVIPSLFLVLTDVRHRGRSGRGCMLSVSFPSDSLEESKVHRREFRLCTRCSPTKLCRLDSKLEAN